MRKKFLERRLARLRAKVTKLMERGNASQDIAEVRAINQEINDLNEEIDEYQAELDEIIEEEQRASDPGATPTSDTVIPSNAVRVGDPAAGQMRASFQAPTTETGPIHGTMEYRRAFMAYVQRGTPIPENLVVRTDIPGPENSQDLGALIPITVMQERATPSCSASAMPKRSMESALVFSSSRRVAEVDSSVFIQFMVIILLFFRKFLNILYFLQKNSSLIKKSDIFISGFYG